MDRCSVRSTNRSNGAPYGGQTWRRSTSSSSCGSRLEMLRAWILLTLCQRKYATTYSPFADRCVPASASRRHVCKLTYANLILTGPLRHHLSSILPPPLRSIQALGWPGSPIGPIGLTPPPTATGISGWKQQHDPYGPVVRFRPHLISIQFGSSLARERWLQERQCGQVRLGPDRSVRRARKGEHFHCNQSPSSRHRSDAYFSHAVSENALRAMERSGRGSCAELV